MEHPMRRGAHRSGARSAVLGAALLALGVAATASADGAVAGDPVARDASTPGARRGRSFDPDERSAATREPSFEGRAADPDERVGEARELREVARPPGPKRAPAVDETDGPAFLRLPRRPGEGLTPAAPLAERFCAAERELAHAREERERALADYKRMRRDGHPRGPAKGLVVERRSLSGRRLARAEDARHALLAEAGEQGVDLDPAACGGEP
jgi:hypothetical protein